MVIGFALLTIALAGVFGASVLALLAAGTHPGHLSFSAIMLAVALLAGAVFVALNGI